MTHTHKCCMPFDGEEFAQKKTICDPLVCKTQKYSSFFRGGFFNALNDEYKNKATPYKHDITTVLPNNDGSLIANYRG